MKKILGEAKNVRALLGRKYAVDYYQREYKWETKQVQELIDDLTTEFLKNYQEGHPPRAVANYEHYFLGAIIVSGKHDANYIVDGQQRLTSLTLLLIFLRSLQKDGQRRVAVDDLIYSERYGEKSFNLDVPQRLEAMMALFEERPLDDGGKDESVRTILSRYADIVEHFPEELTGPVLPYFIDWLIDRVYLVEITASSDEAAYTIFETMNDRGLSLSPTDMLKGYLLTNITNEDQRSNANDLWRRRTQELRDIGKEVESDFFKAWLRGQYARSIRGKEKGAKAEDFDRIGSEFHRWVRDSASERGTDDLAISSPEGFAAFIHQDFDFYSRQYLRLMEASRTILPGLEHIYYNARLGFTLQPMLLLAPLRLGDAPEVVNQKLRLTAMFLDTLLVWRIWNYRSIGQSTLQEPMYRTTLEIRGLEPRPLAEKLVEILERQPERFEHNDRLRLHQMNQRPLHQLLARITDYVEVQSGMPSHYLDYVSQTGKNRYEVEHIWANKPSEHIDEFSQAADFLEYRQRFGGLLLLPKSFNASFGAKTYPIKLKQYNNSQNLLARSLHPDSYHHNPGFVQFVARSGLPFQPHETFKRADLDARQQLYARIAEQVWNPEQLLHEVGL